MIRTDPVTSYLLGKFVNQEETKQIEHTLYRALKKVCDEHLSAELKIAKNDELSPRLIKTAGKIIKENVNREIEQAVEHLATTLVLAREVGTKSTKAKRQKLKKMAEKAIEQEEVKLSIISGAMAMIDFEHIAETLVRVGQRRETEQPVKAGDGGGCALQPPEQGSAGEHL